MMANKRYRIGNAQSIGCREVQGNYFSFMDNHKGDLFAVLADGSIDHPNARRAAIIAVESCVDSFLRADSFHDRFLFESAIIAANRINDSIFSDRSPRVSLAICLFCANQLSFFNVGLNLICLYNSRGEQILLNNSATVHHSGSRTLAHGDSIGIFSPGIHLAANPMDRINIIAASLPTYQKAEAILLSVARKQRSNQLNATALIVEVVK